MQFLSIPAKCTLSQLANIVGSRNISPILALNGLTRVPNIGISLAQKLSSIVSDVTILSPNWQRKISLLNGLTDNSDIFETAAMMDEAAWKIFSSCGILDNRLQIPEDIKLPMSENTLGNGVPVGKSIYNKTIESLKTTQDVDPIIFNEYSASKNVKLLPYIQDTGTTFQYFKLPWGQISLYSSLAKTSIDFPVYPKGFETSRTANYQTMPDILYQYEPWQVYQSSGPREIQVRFEDIHRDMWTGDHRDGKARELIKFCEANCFPEYQGSNVNTALVTLYIAGQNQITGVLKSVNVSWKEDSPIGLDGYFLAFSLTLSIVEVSKDPLNFSSVLKQPLIS